jgi:hypothetical protein
MSLGRSSRFLLVAALLLAQHSALAHPIWHLGLGDAGVSPYSQGASPVTNGNPLCAQHQALDAVLGALNDAAELPLSIDSAPQRGDSPASPSASLAGLAPSSRGPPAFV